jgi:hypothetical protein
MSKASGGIDFVITWVDGQDENWLKKRAQYVSDGDSSVIRYRDFGLLRYWFRSVERFAPWVNKVFLITDHQIPSWINNDNDKLVLVNHEDYIPEEYLPTFNSNVIEFYMHLIPGLSDRFVYFNDDMFVAANVKESYFFDGDLPKDSLVFNAVSVGDKNNTIEHIILNDLELLSRDFSKREIVKNRRKVYRFGYGSGLMRNLLLAPWHSFTGISNPHVPISYRKDIFFEVWEKYGNELSNSSFNRFRTEKDLNHWLFRYYQLFSMRFSPKKIKRDIFYSLQGDNSVFLKQVKRGRYSLICINDDNVDLDMDKTGKELVSFFDSMFPDKSSFEK